MLKRIRKVSHTCDDAPISGGVYLVDAFEMASKAAGRCRRKRLLTCIR